VVSVVAIDALLMGWRQFIFTFMLATFGEKMGDELCNFECSNAVMGLHDPDFYCIETNLLDDETRSHRMNQRSLWIIHSNKPPNYDNQTPMHSYLNITNHNK
jgi:hypothetical protein